MNPQRQQQWTAILDDSREMLRLAEAGRWEALVDIQQQRDRRLQAFFAAPASIDEAGMLRQGIHEIQALDQKILRLGEHGQARLRDELSDLGRHHRAHSAYQQTTPE